MEELIIYGWTRLYGARAALCHDGHRRAEETETAEDCQQCLEFSGKGLTPFHSRRCATFLPAIHAQPSAQIASIHSAYRRLP